MNASAELPAETVPPALHNRQQGVGARFDRMMERAGEFLNPILVKEARQALKSRQFLITFLLVLVAGWIWSIVGVAFMTPQIFHSPRGSQMLVGYYWILLFPLAVIVPFGAFRSLAIEIEDGTFDLISVSTLTPRQIIDGKMGSALLQGLIYLSALSPCIAFTYLLRGIDFLTILILLFYTGLLCVALCVYGLFLATVSSTRVWQLLVSVKLVIGLFINFAWIGIRVSEFLNFSRPLPFESQQFWALQVAVFCVVGSFALLLYAAAAARITFPSENRSTRLRRIMLAQQCIMLGWMVYLFGEIREPTIVATLSLASAAYWLVMGAMMIGESAQPSQRIKRTLPQTTLSRTLLQWFTPGPYTGYQFAVLNMVTVATFVGLLFLASRDHNVSQQFMTTSECLWIVVTVTAYLGFYLGLSLLAVRAASKVTTVSPLFGFLVTTLIFMVGTLVPFTVRISFDEYIRPGFQWWEITNPFAAISQLTINTSPTGPPVYATRIKACVLTMGISVYLVNLIIGATQVRVEREEAPQRVQEDEQFLRTEKEVRSVEMEVHPLDED